MRPIGQSLAQALGYRHFRLYWSSDMTGVQLGGALKNVLAIAAGIVDGRQLGASAHAALVTRGFAEMQRFGAGLGAQAEHADGPVRSRRPAADVRQPAVAEHVAGTRIGRRGNRCRTVLGSRRSVAEGVFTAAAIIRVAGQLGVEMPICEAVHAIVEGTSSVDDAISGLLARPFKAES